MERVKVNTYRVLEKSFEEMYNVLRNEDHFNAGRYRAIESQDDDFITYAFKSGKEEDGSNNTISIVYDRNNKTVVVMFRTFNRASNTLLINDKDLDFDDLVYYNAKGLFKELYNSAYFNNKKGIFTRNISLSCLGNKIDILEKLGYIDYDICEEIKDRIEEADYEDFESCKKILEEYIDIENYNEFIYDIDFDIIWISCIFKEIEKRFYLKK